MSDADKFFNDILPGPETAACKAMMRERNEARAQRDEYANYAVGLNQIAMELTAALAQLPPLYQREGDPEHLDREAVMALVVSWRTKWDALANVPKPSGESTTADREPQGQPEGAGPVVDRAAFNAAHGLRDENSQMHGEPK